MNTKLDELEICDKLEELQSNIKGLNALTHIFLEGIRTDSVGADEIVNAMANLYILTEIITHRIEYISSHIRM